MQQAYRNSLGNTLSPFYHNFLCRSRSRGSFLTTTQPLPGPEPTNEDSRLSTPDDKEEEEETEEDDEVMGVEERSWQEEVFESSEPRCTKRTKCGMSFSSTNFKEMKIID